MVRSYNDGREESAEIPVEYWDLRSNGISDAAAAATGVSLYGRQPIRWIGPRKLEHVQGVDQWKHNGYWAFEPVSLTLMALSLIMPPPPHAAVTCSGID
jgi:hypothetical protein